MKPTTRSLAPALAASAVLTALAAPASAQIIDDRPVAQVDVDSRALAVTDSKKVTFPRIFFENVGQQDLSGKLAIKYRGKTLGSQSVDVDSGYDGDGDDVALPAKVTKRLDKKRRLPLTVSGTLSTETGVTQRISKKVTLFHSGPGHAFDGTYRGTGGLTIVVQAGIVQNINVGVNLFCPKSGSNMTRSLSAVSGFPAFVSKGGKFKASGSGGGSDTVRYEGTLSRKGTSKGYLSLFYTQLGATSEGRLDPEQCYGASNWTAKRR